MSTLMEAVAADGVSVVLSSHVLSELERVCDYLVLLSRGSVQIAGAVDELVANHRVFTGPVEQADAVAAALPVVHQSVPGGRRVCWCAQPTSARCPPDGWTIPAIWKRSC